jgi:NAD(P)-dependent dehydrogenase (short-subunit alcohol dehydrogenase family)
VSDENTDNLFQGGGIGMNSNKSKVIVITGASGGIGVATSLAFLKKGYIVAGLDRYSLIQALAAGSISTESIEKLNQPNYHHIVVNILDEESLAAALAEVSKLGEIAHAFSVAGGAYPQEVKANSIDEVDRDSVKASIDLNITSQIFFAQAVLPYLRETAKQYGDSSLTFTSSINALKGLGLHAYAAAKAGSISLARTLSVEEGNYGVRVNTIIPGGIKTLRTTIEWAHEPNHFIDLAKANSLGKLITEEDISDTFIAIALYLKAMTGQTLVIDNGAFNK